MPTDQDLFAEEQTMTTMSFGEHIEDLRTHLIRAIKGLVLIVTLAFILDAVGAAFLLGGLGLSGYMSPIVALVLLVAYLLVLVETCLASYTLGAFTMSYAKVGPTELRILLVIGNLVVLVHPMSEIFGRTFLLFDVSGVIATITPPSLMPTTTTQVDQGPAAQ